MPPKPDEPPVLSPQSTAASLRTANVLVVDDDPGVLLLLEETLVDAGFNVVSAQCGEDALRTCEDFRPDLALLDINMPGMDGIETCQTMRERCGEGFPIVMVTSVDDAMSIQSAFEAGASDFILKPINWPLFQRRMEFIISEWRHATEINESNKRLEALQRIAPEQVMLVSRNGVIIEDLKERTSGGVSRAVGVFPTLDELYGPEASQRFKQCISAVLKTRKTKSLSFTAERWGMQRECQADFQVDGRDRVIVVVQTVDNQPDNAPEEVYRLAFFDQESGVPNEHLFRRVARNHIADALLQDRSMAVFSVHPHPDDSAAFDAEARARFDEALTQALGDASTVVSIGDRGAGSPFALGNDNEYLVLVDKVQTGDEVQVLLDGIAAAAAATTLALDVATCVAMLPTDGSSVDDLLAAARGAAREAALDGKPATAHGSGIGLAELHTLDYARELRDALDKDQLELHFQPRMALASGRITSVEALLRWNHPIRGYVNLLELLPLAEATGVILDIGDWVLKTACELAVQWPGGMGAPKVSVNLSRQELLQEGLVARLRDVIAATGLDAARLELEVTESALLRARDAERLLSRIRSLGLGLVLDDFGTGFSSLDSLKRFPIDGLKIDASFVRRSTSDSADASICEIIIMMAHRMGLKAIAEGVETEQELAFLAAHACDEVQGYVVSKPIPGEGIGEFLAHVAAQHQNLT